MSNAVERTREVGLKVEDLGTYHAERERIKASLNLKARIVVLGVIDSGMDWYVGDFNFYTKPQWIGDKEGFSVKIRYSFNSLKEIFTRVKRAEKGIESLLAPPDNHYWDRKSATDIIGCILSLEDQTKHLYEKRQQATEERRAYVRGREASTTN